MYDELVKRLREAPNDWPDADLHYEAADAIEELSMKLLGANAAIYGMQREIERTVVYGNKPKWVPVTERLPEDGSDILAFESYCGYERIIPANHDGGVWFDCVYDRVAEHITHWMPLPEPPKEE